MANHTFKYPNATAPTNTLTFDLPAHLVEDVPILEPNQVIEHSKGGTTFVESFGDAKQIFPFTAYIWADSGSATDETDVRAFLTACNYGVSTFVWTDKSAVARTVRLLSASIGFAPVADKRQVSFMLEVQ